MAGARRRLILATGAVVGAALVAGVVLALGGDSAPSGAGAAPAPTECIDRWNDDSNALSYGRHNLTFHSYERAQVGFLPETEDSARVSSDAAEGPCAVVFPRSVLDPEPAAAGEVYSGNAWRPISALVDPGQLGALQSTALRAANARITEAGELEPLR